eukprot:TRINITY_DN1616_c0_g1_i9.p1 TRINITY_DN1616_c0_g1~~TRINITY_DN1616_c0_g1_i9.p1  ORF type:complete len:536 (-),score=166.65 TRINITY_DN1616_c0_g1_i9:853-2349(-)
MKTRARAESDGKPTCLICCEPVEVFSVGDCNHRDVCALCCLRRRFLYNQLTCCMCMEDQKRVLFTTDPKKHFKEFELTKCFFDNVLNLYFTEEHVYQQVIDVLQLRCTVCSPLAMTQFTSTPRPPLPPPVVFQYVEDYITHVKTTHGLAPCDICLQDRKVFFVEQMLFSPGGFAQHMKEWDGGISEAIRKIEEDQRNRPSAEVTQEERELRKWSLQVKAITKGHPACLFCHTAYYGPDQLYEHLRKEHLQCSLCEEAGVLWQYYVNYNELEKHFDRAHFLCHDNRCLEQKFVVFRTLIDLKSHQATEHEHEHERGVSLELNFQVRRQGRDGEGIAMSAEDDVTVRTRRRDHEREQEQEREQRRQQQPQQQGPRVNVMFRQLQTQTQSQSQPQPQPQLQPPKAEPPPKAKSPPPQKAKSPPPQQQSHTTSAPPPEPLPPPSNNHKLPVAEYVACVIFLPEGHLKVTQKKGINGMSFNISAHQTHNTGRTATYSGACVLC